MQSKGITFTLRALAHLLRYPDATMRAHLTDIHTALNAEDAIGRVRRAELDTLMDRLLTDGLDAEAVYVDLFDRGRGTALHLFEHVHGDSRDRGPAMVDLVQTYEAAGLLLEPTELPDHLTVLLEYASTQPTPEARAFVGEFAHILQSIHAALARRQSDYAAVVAAVLDLSGQPLDAKAAVPADEPLDESWEEPQAFGGCSTEGQSAPGPKPIQLIRRQPSAGAAR
ncbi:nitrate reductase molybdenum cofactor assembly chaperone [Ottowia oryzae]|uniref:Nitrate reductase molybdenum cofactor assembly chaperone n=1 Tax=Ottowia oryzae TaxID=2109914 RepID=A0A2S0MAC7_9BURK|nr:nitrate reductase molybdenum cofactor assembly chaperone [Ottowia oryzae]AVO32825.1 nitrate reductase molybdenum cofactor assembly chaperone [Ottowia oryzae]